jgi:two-component system OmpR family response regulator
MTSSGGYSPYSEAVAGRKTTILVVDDEENILSLMAETLRLVGFEALTSSRGADALAKIRSEQIDLALLDINMPVMDGYEVMERMRQIKPQLPVIMLSARQEKQEVIAGLRKGADDYVSKPFSVEEVVMRINAVLRRTQGDLNSSKIVVGPITLDTDTFQVYFLEDAVSLSKTEFRLLHYLSERAGKVVTKEALLDAVWGYSFDTSTNVVDTYISYLRKKLHREGYEGIRTVRGVGFQISEK